MIIPANLIGGTYREKIQRFRGELQKAKDSFDRNIQMLTYVHTLDIRTTLSLS